MEQISEIFGQLEDLVQEDLNKIQTISNSSVIDELTDSIRINLSAQISAAKILIEDKARLREIRLKSENKLHVINGNQYLCLILGVAKHTNTVRAKGKFVVIWSKQHRLNLVRDNILSVKSKNNSTILALIAACNQASVLRIKKLMVMTNNAKLKNIVDSLELLFLQNFTDDERLPLPDAELLKMLHRTVSEAGISIQISVSVPEPPLDKLYFSLMETAGDMMDRQG